MAVELRLPAAERENPGDPQRLAMISRIGLRHRIPLQLVLMAVGSSLFVAIFVLWHDIRSVDRDARLAGRQFARLLAHAVARDLMAGDTRQAYQALTSLLREQQTNWLLPALAIVVDDQSHTLVSTQPARFPPGRPIAALHQLQDRGFWVVKAPIRLDATRPGALILAFPTHRLWPRHLESLHQIGVATLVFVLFMAPVGWLVGRRLARPIASMIDCVSRLGEVFPEGHEPDCRIDGAQEELAQLARRIQEVTEVLAERRELERQMALTERQASLGRLATGIAHEINNPLGGMLNAIAIQKRHGEDPQVTRETLELIERGLQQIQGIVGALLVEVRAEQREFSPRDLTDIQQLIGARLHEKRLELVLDAPAQWSVDVPAGPVRQMILNLLLNAVQASPPERPIELRLEASHGLKITVANEGPDIPPDRQATLFEPAIGKSPKGHGLGLWITHQIVQQLGGTITVRSAEGRTQFSIELPGGPQDADE